MTLFSTGPPSLHIMDTSLEVRISAGSSALQLQTYTQVLTEIRLALEEVDKLAVHGRVPRIQWAIGDLRKDDGIRITLVPARIPSRRPVTESKS